MEHYNRYQHTRFNRIDDEWSQYPNRERQQMYNDDRKFYRQHHYDPKHPSQPVPYAKNVEEDQDLSRNADFGYNDPSHYPLNRGEFGRGQSENMNPGRMESYGENSYRGFSNRATVGRDYESNAGYRENYNKLDTRPGPGYEYEFAQLRKQETGPYKGKGPRSYKRKDDRILEDINDRMCDNPYLDASEIEVGINNGEVILEGTVEDRDAKRMAADIAENVSGVDNVVNRLHVEKKGI
jgi:hypothetical protein